MVFSVNVDKLTRMKPSEKESYESVADSIIDMSEEDEPVVISVVGEGTMAFKLADTLYAKGGKVIFIDADLRDDIFIAKYRVGRDLKGVANYLVEEIDYNDIICLTNKDNFKVIFTGMSDYTMNQEMKVEKISNLFKQLKEDFDWIVVLTDDSGKIASMCDETVVMLKQSDYSEMSSEIKVKQLDEAGCYVLGVVVNE